MEIYILIGYKFIFNKIRKVKIERDDYDKVKTFYNDILKKIILGILMDIMRLLINLKQLRQFVKNF